MRQKGYGRHESGCHLFILLKNRNRSRDTSYIKKQKIKIEAVNAAEFSKGAVAAISKGSAIQVRKFTEPICI